MNTEVKMFQLILNDTGNLSLQVIMVSENEGMLSEAAENMNFLFNQAGRQDQFVAEVLPFNLGEGGN